MSLTRPSPEFTPSATLHEAILASSSSVRDSLPEQHREHFETLRQEIIDFAQAHEIPRESLTKPDALREAANELSTPDLQRLATLLELFEHLLVHHEPMREKLSEAREYTEEFYHLEKQYTSQVKLLEQVGILKEGMITGIDGNKYPIPTLEQIADRLFERRKELSTKHDQGFTKLLLVPFGMSLGILCETLKQFLLKHKKDHSDFELDVSQPFWKWPEYQGGDTGNFPKIIYYPKFFCGHDHQGKTKMQILGEQEDNQAPFPGWTIHLFQSSDPINQDSIGFAPIPRQGQGTPQGDENPRPPLEAGQSANEYLSILQKAQDDPCSPYSHESGMTPEDWIIAFILHLQETGKPMDNWQNNTESISYLTGAFFPSSVLVPVVCWDRGDRRAGLYRGGPRNQNGDIGARFSVMV